MKILRKILIFILTLGMLACTMFAIGAFAEEGEAPETTPEEGGEIVGDPSDPLWTPYGMITKSAEEVYTTDENGEITYITPFAVFEKTGDDSYVFVSTHKLFASDSNKAEETSALRTCQREAKEMIVYFLSDAEHNVAYHNTSNIYTKVTIDMNGHTLFYSAYLNAQAKGDPTKNYPELTFKNGKLVATAARNFVVASPSSTTFSAANKVVFNFQNVTFALDDDTSSAPPTWILTTTTPSADNLKSAADSGRSYKEHSFEMNITDCIFDIRNVAKAITLFSIGDVTEKYEGANDVGYLVDCKVNIKGSNILGTNNYITMAAVRGKETNGLFLQRGDNGNYITNTRETDSVRPNVAIDMDGFDMVFIDAIGEADGMTTYALKKNPLQTPYGTIPDDRASVQDWPFVVFDENKKFIGAYEYFAEDSSSAMKAAAEKAGRIVYMRRDYTHETTFNNIAFQKEVTIDLNGKVLSYSKTMNGVSKGSTQTLSKITIKNGTFEAVGSTTFVEFAPYAYDNSGYVFNFENVTFRLDDDPSADPLYMLMSVKSYSQADIVAKNYKPYTVRCYIKDCIFDVGNIRRASACFFGIGDSSGLADFQVEIKGSTIYGSSNTIQWADVQGEEKNGVFFAPNDAGKYVTNIRYPVNIGSEKKPVYQMSKAPQYLSVTIDGKCYSFVKKVSETTVNNVTEATFELEEMNLNTPYGTIPAQYANIDSFPFVVFDADTKEVIGGSDRWGGEAKSYAENNDGTVKTNALAGGVLQIMVNHTKRNLILYLRTDHQDTIDENGSAPAAFYNFGHLSGTQIIDLGGHTLYVPGPVFFETCKNQGKVTTLDLTVKNGTINLKDRVLVQLADNNYAEGGDKTTKYTFKDINFINIGSNYLIRENSGGYDLDYDFIFEDCTFNIVQSYVNSFYYGKEKTVTDENGQTQTQTSMYTVRFTIKGGTFNYGIASHFTFVDPKYDKVSVSFEEGKNGYSIINTKASSSLAISNGILYQTSAGESMFLLDEKTADTYTFRFGKMHESGYGYVPYSYDDKDAHPIIVFDKKNGYAVTSSQRIGGIVGEWGNGDSDPYNVLYFLRHNTQQDSYYIVLLQKDITTTVYNNFGNTAGTIEFDLNGKSITLGKTLFQAQAKNSKALTVITKNGTIVVGSNAVVDCGSIETGTGKNMSFTFEGVAFEDVSYGRLVSDNLSGDYAVTMSVDFINCSIDVSSGYSKYLFNFSNLEGRTINVTFRGGSINYNGDTVPAPVNTYEYANKTVQFLPYEEKYTVVTTKLGANTDRVGFLTDNGMRYLRKISDDETVATYTFSKYGFIGRSLNIQNDLNMMFSAFLPEGSNPTVIFDFAGMKISAKSIGRDENGLYIFKLAGVTPAKMNEEIVATLTVADGSIKSTYTDSIKSYLDALLQAYGEVAGYENMTSLVKSLLVYGAAAQQYVNGNTDGFSPETLAQLGALEAVPELVAEKGTNSTSLDKYALNLSGKIYLRVGVDLADPTGYILEATKGDTTTTYNVADYPASGTTIAITYEGFMASELDKAVTFTLKNANGEVIDTLTVSANAYLYSASISTNKKLATLAKALYAYGEAAKAFVAK